LPTDLGQPCGAFHAPAFPKQSQFAAFFTPIPVKSQEKIACWQPGIPIFLFTRRRTDFSLTPIRFSLILFAEIEPPSSILSLSFIKPQRQPSLASRGADRMDWKDLHAHGWKALGSA
jgi:hypothetical protein